MRHHGLLGFLQLFMRVVDWQVLCLGRKIACYQINVVIVKRACLPA